MSLHIFLLEPETSCLVFGASSAKIEDPIALLESLREMFPRTVIQIVDARFVAGVGHARLVAQQTLEARKRNLLYAKKTDLDLLVRLALENQISRAIERAGIRKGTMDVVIIALGPSEELARLPEQIRVGVPDDGVIELTKSKEEFLLKIHQISESELGATVIAGRVLPYLLAEKAAILSIE